MQSLLFQLDANVVNAKQGNHDINELELLANEGIVELEYSEIAYCEASYNNERRLKKAKLRTWARLANESEFQSSWRIKIAEAVFPKVLLNDNQRNDVEILLTAKISGAILVTTDGASKTQPRGILGSKKALKELGIAVVTPREAVALAEATMLGKML